MDWRSLRFRVLRETDIRLLFRLLYALNKKKEKKKKEDLVIDCNPIRNSVFCRCQCIKQHNKQHIHMHTHAPADLCFDVRRFGIMATHRHTHTNQAHYIRFPPTNARDEPTNGEMCG